ncbi:Microtubuleassociated protein futschlike [Caligus rogercresseyi]|uniref:Microtubuleassociated protein futschlike n=1 Tax=Caligus rogercresseyi TaxID=217165 RepID=A0A7T8JU86_CALRO|nr:Microtubuleassociated protein futschlike [Caligus rogercresseyi]
MNGGETLWDSESEFLAKYIFSLFDLDSGISVHYFRGLIAETQIQMEDLCSSWEKKLSIGDNFDENMCGQIRTVVGQARILTNERGRLTQFKSLVDNCEFWSRGKRNNATRLAGMKT